MPGRQSWLMMAYNNSDNRMMINVLRMVPIEVTLVGIVTDVSEVHDEKAPDPNNYGDNNDGNNNKRNNC